MTHDSTPMDSPSARLRGHAGRLLTYAALWWVLVGTDPRSWLIGLPAVGVALLAAAALAPTPSTTWRLGGLLRFAPYFLWQSLRGGFVVACWVLRRRLDVRPVVVEHRTRLPEGRACAFLAGVAGLLPGTLVADLDGQRLRVHVLDESIRVHEEIERLEQRVADLFGTSSRLDGASGHE